MEHTTIAVDLAKSVFQVAVSHQPGRVDEERRLSRDSAIRPGASLCGTGPVLAGHGTVRDKAKSSGVQTA